MSACCSCTCTKCSDRSVLIYGEQRIESDKAKPNWYLGHTADSAAPKASGELPVYTTFLPTGSYAQI